MNQMNQPGRWKSLLMGLIFSVSSLLAGGLLGILYVKLFVPAKEMGWDGIADMLGGLMVGGAIGLFAGIYLAWKLPLRKQAMGTGALLLIFGITLLGLKLAAPDRDAAPTEQIEQGRSETVTPDLEP